LFLGMYTRRYLFITNVMGAFVRISESEPGE